MATVGPYLQLGKAFFKHIQVFITNPLFLLTCFLNHQIILEMPTTSVVLWFVVCSKARFKPGSPL